jgi:glyoxylase-like metal-dependent hydrolase (beta-lactamase superfamily II)
MSRPGTFRWSAAALLAMAIAAASCVRSLAADPQGSVVHPFKVQGNVWMLVGAGANIAMQAGKEGVFLVDTGAPGTTDAVLAAIRQVTDAPIRYVVNTSLGPDRIGGNAAFAALSGGSTLGKGHGPMPALIAHDNMLLRMSTPDASGKAPYPANAWPSDAYMASQRNVFFNGEVVDIIHKPAAHTDGDSIVYFRGSNVLVSGDIFTTTNLPLIDRKQGGTSRGMLDALNAMLDIAVPENMQEGGTYIIPGHGRVCDEADLVEYRDMLHEIRDRMHDLVNVQHLTLEQVKARRPVLGWEGRYSRPEWTTDMFVEALYQEFSGNGK